MELIIRSRISDERVQLGLSMGYMCGWMFDYKGKLYASFGQYKEKQTKESLKKEALETFDKIK